MERGTRLGTLRLGVAVAASVVAVLLFAETVRSVTGVHAVGPPLLLWLSVPVVVLGGVVGGPELAVRSFRSRRRPVIAITQLLTIGAAVTPALVYAGVAAPRYFDAETILLWYWPPIATGAVLVTLLHGVGAARDAFRASS